jgi:hypothetical protein
MNIYGGSKEVQALIKEKLEQVNNLFREVGALAEEHDVSVSTNILDIWGTGLTYIPPSEKEDMSESYLEELQDNEGWQASASSC